MTPITAPHVVCTYIHLNPGRAQLIRVGQEGLKRYRWSSYPLYLKRAGQRLLWLRSGQVMASLRLGPKDVKGYEAYIEGRVLESANHGRRLSGGGAPADALDDLWAGVGDAPSLLDEHGDKFVAVESRPWPSNRGNVSAGSIYSGA